MIQLSSYKQSLRAFSHVLMVLMLAFATLPAEAQTVGTIRIGGKVYGGGKEGAINSGNTTATSATSAEEVTLIKTSFNDKTVLADYEASQASQVTINSGNILAIFGGGEKGRSYGKTSVYVKGSETNIGFDVVAEKDVIDALPETSKSVCGNVFGAGDGTGADVFGGSYVLVEHGTINGSVYGGGNRADIVGSTELTLQGGTYVGAVFGGAKQADVWGHTFVNIDGKNAKNDLHIIDVYGGNDIAGNIHPTTNGNWAWAMQENLHIPAVISLPSTGHLTKYPADKVNSEWNAFVYVSDPATSDDDDAKSKKVLIDNIFGGGNGDYDYATSVVVDDKETNPYYGLSKPVIDRTYLQIEGGMYGSLYGGGNAASVGISTDICLINSTEASAEYIDGLESSSRARYSADYQFNRVFGGNNKEPMSIRPNWYLERASVNNLYSGGNAGAMTYFHQTSTGGNTLAADAGILIHVESADMTVNNVYGGCRMADVDPNGHKGLSMTINPETYNGHSLLPNYAARVLITGGKINNVYGGNDVSGIVYYGSDVEIKSSIIGNVYGAGNGSYAYTDNVNLKDDPVWGDYYYDKGSRTSAEALNIHRPNAATSLVHILGTSSVNPTYIGGGVYCGGNSATLRADINNHATTDGDLAGATANLQLGSYVVADKVFLGSNGENMVKSATANDLLQIYKNGPAGYDAAANGPFNTMDLTDSADFEDYMRGVEVAIRPKVTTDKDYVPQTTKIGSLYGGGNVGSMTAPGTFELEFLDNLVIYNKLVGGCNNANVEKTAYNAFHLGGLTNNNNLEKGNKVQLDINGVQFEPRKLIYDEESNTFSLDWNVEDMAGTAVVDDEHPENNKEADKMLVGGNIYGGCYASGFVNGGVVINITKNAIGNDVFAAAPTGSGVTYEAVRDDVLASTLAAYGGGYGPETEIWGNVTIDIFDDGCIMKAYGGGEQGVVGKLDRDTDGHYGQQVDDGGNPIQEWYSETIFKDVHGYNTPVTEYRSRDHYMAKFAEDGTYNAIVNLNANLLADNKLNVAKLYGGGFQGTISGNTTVNLNRGRVYDAFGGASNADILGHTEMYVGKSSAPTVTHNVYGANDFGGLIVGEKRFDVVNTNHEMEKVVAQTYVEYSSGYIAGDLFGGPCGAYHYADNDHLKMATNLYTYNQYKALPGNESITKDDYDALSNAEKTKPGSNFCRPQLLKEMLTGDMLVKHSGAGYAANSFVNIVSNSALATDRINGSIFGAGQGLQGFINLADERGSYVRLKSATKSERTAAELSHRVYGAGYCSNTNRSLVDAYTGYFGIIFGGAHGITYEDVLHLIDEQGHYETNYMGFRSAVRLHEMDNDQMDIYGGGANAGAQEAGVVLNGGEAHNVYGASYAQGITYAASVEVPAGSTSKVNAIFGGAEGGSDEFPCDAYNTFVTWNSENARVKDAIYGGNNNFRMTRNAYIAINKPVKNYDNQLADVFGGGFGPETVTLYTSVGLQDGAQVANVYGGGNNGQVLDTPSFRYYLDDGILPLINKDEAVSATNPVKPAADHLKTYPAELLGTGIYGYQKYLHDSEVIGFHDWIVNRCWDGVTLDGRGQPLGSYTANAHGHAHPVYFLSTQMDGMKNTNVYIMKGAFVEENAYGGGKGGQALVSGETSVHLWGGTVEGDIYGGGYGGHVQEYDYLIGPAGGQLESTMSSTNVELNGGIARNVYGGGLNGHVVGSTNVVLGTRDQGKYDFYGTSISGQYEHQVYVGDPIVERSLYGGGQMGHVEGSTYVTLNQGHVGYKYNPDVTIATTMDETLKEEYYNSDTTLERKEEILKQICYVENIDLNDEGDGFLDQNGNLFGAGYGEGAYVNVTYVNLYGGTIRNSLYGGGEIAAVGQGVMVNTVGANKELDHIDVAGRTHIYMYDGLVKNDVFGGGRGYSYDLTGNEVVGKTLYTDGYVFGTTEVEIRGGEIGTPVSMLEGHGNVFGGGNIGYCFSDAQKKGYRGDHDGEGRYYTNEWECTQAKCRHHERSFNKPTVCSQCGNSVNATDPRFRTDFFMVNEGEPAKYLSEDCRVIITPYAQVTASAGIKIDGTLYQKGEYVPTDILDLLHDKNTDVEEWRKIDLSGVTVRNAVFAGGNVSAGSDKVYANAVTVFGNATATIKDVFFRDLVTIGTDRVGGLYGDGNLTFVDGYRELNVTNYGTDYYGQNDHITLDEYRAMNDRERAYFELEYMTSHDIVYSYHVCNVPYAGHDKGEQITPDEYAALSADDKTHWSTESANKSYAASAHIKQNEWQFLPASIRSQWDIYGFCSIYAGRILNTIQRADYCGVFGSRLVLQGAQDRVPEVVDYTQYTINRVREVSLNKKTVGGETHGNYFGLYNIVNYLGALTSDVAFEEERRWDNSNAEGYQPKFDGQTYYEWKEDHVNDRKRNNGTSHNMVALASGVYLEIVEEPSATSIPGEKDWGPITGIIELDLINVMTGLGGGYVYAKNIHGVRSTSLGTLHENLSKYNQDGVIYSNYTYDSSNPQDIETSGNFIHKVKQIVDDCYPIGGDVNSPAHYWYIRGEFYVYDQYISAYTGSSTAYTENINLPLTITAGANGRLDLLDIKGNYYAYYRDELKTEVLNATDAIVVNNLTYSLNDVITWWDYMQLSDEQKNHFVPETYVATKRYCLNASDIDSNGEAINVIEAGGVAIPGDYDPSQTVYDPDDITETSTGVFEMRPMLLSEVYHVSNAVNHDNGYVLTVDLSNPRSLDRWYSAVTSKSKINADDYNKSTTEKSNYIAGPSFYTTAPGVYGQRMYAKDDIVTKTVVDIYNLLPSDDKATLTNQATVKPAYVAVASAQYTYMGNVKNVQTGVGISEDEYKALSGDVQAKFAPALTCTSTYEENRSENLFIYYGELISETKYQQLLQELTTRAENPLTDAAAKTYLSQYFDQAYIVTNDMGGLYGGQHFAANTNYRAIDTWATLSSEDREHFHYSYDALDALALSNYSNVNSTLGDYPGTGIEGPGENYMQLYDGSYWDGSNGYPTKQIYGAKQAIDYTAEFTGASRVDISDVPGIPYLEPGEIYPREKFELLPNEQRHYNAINVSSDQVGTTYYFVREAFSNGSMHYAAGKTIDAALYAALDTERQAKVETFTPSAVGRYFFCRENYTIDNNANGHAVTDISAVDNQGTIAKGSEVKCGVIIGESDYTQLTNYQNGDGVSFIIHGNAPIETSTFYVNRESVIDDLSKERVVTVIYQYKYEESDESGLNIEEITERHIINIHIDFKSGVPTIGRLQDPSIVLPGQTVGLKLPNVTPGAYEILGGGWEIFTDEENAAKHQNGKPYVNNATPMYWYQDGYWVAYYAKTYLGKTYSNAVKFKVANYHDIADVMADTENHMFVDHPDVQRNSKIYIDNSYTDENPAATKSEIDMLYDIFETSLAEKKKIIMVDVQDTDAGGNPLYYKVVDGVVTSETTLEFTPYPVVHKEPAEVPVFDDHARNCANLSFYLSDDVKSIKDHWTSIGHDPDGVPGSPDEDGQCFMGDLHGMGFTISGLDHSLFAELCGNVYNLGVTGSFTKSGVADRVMEGVVPDSDPERKVYGYVNSSWIYTSAAPTDVDAASNNANPAQHYYPVVGTPNNFTHPDGVLAGMHVHNCFFPQECGYDISDKVAINPLLVANSATLRQFNTGEVAYNLNGFYLNKRYSDNVGTINLSTIDHKTVNGKEVGDGDDVVYQYWKQTSTGQLIKENYAGPEPAGPVTGYYKGGGSMHAYDGKNLGYVERIYADGDFVYRNGTIPTEQNERYSISESRYLPIWPDDYYFFGQQLSYGYDEINRPYQPLPAKIHKTPPSKEGGGQDFRLLQSKDNNIIFRIPAYFRSKEKNWTHFNPYAIFADSMKEDYHLSAADVERGLTETVLGVREVHPGLTAIDFTGFNDRAVMLDAGTDHQKFQSVANSLTFTNTYRVVSSKPGYDAAIHSVLNDDAYFAPLTDYTTLMGIETHGITQNLLAYAPTTTWSPGTANTQTVLRDYFNEPLYATYYSGETPDAEGHTYRTVNALDASKISGVHGHLIMKENKASDRHYYYAASDHYLVDRQDFNAPFEYEFNSAKGDYRMWYQRTPDYYADAASGWEGISLPFSAELVTTQNKGEITHFYNSALGSAYNAGKTSGHEYWLREFTESISSDDPEVTTAYMNYPVEDALNSKTVTSTFLWDYYYNANGVDANGDLYKKTNGSIVQDDTRVYYAAERQYDGYPLSVPGRAYIAGFPGSRYYEFDLSGTFQPEHSGAPFGGAVPARLSAQTISFVSDNDITIRVSDDEVQDAATTPDGSDYTFHGNYLNIVAPVSAGDNNYYTLNSRKETAPSSGKYISSFEKTTVATPVAAFRPFFSTAVAPALRQPASRSIVFGMKTSDGTANDDQSFGGNGELFPDNGTIDAAAQRGLRIYARRGKVVVESTLDYDRTVSIITPAGMTLTTFTVPAGETVATSVNEGVYIVNRKKLLVN